MIFITSSCPTAPTMWSSTAPSMAMDMMWTTLASIFYGYGNDCEQHWQVPLFSMAMDMTWTTFTSIFYGYGYDVNNIGKYFLWLWIWFWTTLASIFYGYGYDCKQHWQVFSLAMDMIVNNICKYFLWLWIWLWTTLAIPVNLWLWIWCEQHWQVFSVAMELDMMSTTLASIFNGYGYDENNILSE